MIMRLYEKGNFTLESELSRTTFETRIAQKLEEVKQILPRMSRQFRRCDPRAHVEGKTFVRMTNLLQVGSSEKIPVVVLMH
jgi:hypothetical protein